MPDHTTDWNGIIIRCSDRDTLFPTKVREALATIDNRRLGHSLLRSIEKRADQLMHMVGYAVCIVKPNGAHGRIEDGKVMNSWGNIAIRISEERACNGSGSPTAVKWNPNLIRGDGADRPPFIALAHELIHAMNNARGTAFSDDNVEEMKTVGLGPHANDRKRNENAIRAEHHLPLRTKYTGIYEP